MIAYVTSIGESTTDLCVWSLKRQGFEVRLIEDPTSLWDKLVRIYKEVEDDFIRVDADVIVNRQVKSLIKKKDLWWYQGYTYDWFQQNRTHGGVQFIRKEAFPAIRQHISEAQRLHRPESYLYRLEEFHNPRRCGTFKRICGLNGYKQSNVQRVKDTKAERGQSDNYDFELAERIETL